MKWSEYEKQFQYFIPCPICGKPLKEHKKNIQLVKHYFKFIDSLQIDLFSDIEKILKEMDPNIDIEKMQKEVSRRERLYAS